MAIVALAGLRTRPAVTVTETLFKLKTDLCRWPWIACLSARQRSRCKGDHDVGIEIHDRGWNDSPSRAPTARARAFRNEDVDHLRIDGRRLARGKLPLGRVDAAKDGVQIALARAHERPLALGRPKLSTPISEAFVRRGREQELSIGRCQDDEAPARAVWDASLALEIT